MLLSCHWVAIVQQGWSGYWTLSITVVGERFLAFSSSRLATRAFSYNGRLTESMYVIIDKA
jgi:hypothetical protein